MEKTIKYLENGEYHYATVRSVGDLAQLKTDSKETLVEAINELWNGGGNADPSKAPKPEGYDQLVQDVADAVKNQQEIGQQWIEWQNEEAQLTEERKQAYLQAMKEMQEAIDKAKADAAALDDKTAKLDEQITKTFSDLDTSIQNMHEQLQKEADRMNQDLINTKSDLTKVRTDLQSAQMDNGKIHDELTNINGKFEHKVWQTDLDPLKEQIDRAETSVQQTKDELLGKASRQDLDTVTNTVSKLDTQLKETAKGVEISVKKDELGGEIAEALTNKTNILLGTRRFTTNNWTQRDHVEICSDPWKGFLVAKQNSSIEGIQQAYEAKAGTTYTFSLFAKMDTLDDSNKPQIILAKNNLDTSLDTKIDVWRKDIEDITSDFKRYDLTFTPSEDCTIYPHIISNSNNPIFVCGYQLEIGKTSTPWEPNQEDVGDYVEKSEAQFNVYNDKIQALTEKQRQQGDTQEQLRTEVTQTAEGVKQVSESLKNTNGDITKLRGDLERTADHMKSEYESYTNKAVGQISDSTLNLIRNSSFQNKDSDFDQWQNISAKANVRSDENGLRWVELTQSGLTTNNPEGITSNYFNIKQGKVTVAVDIKSGDKASLDNDSVLSLELYNDVKKRVDFYDVSLSQLGLSKELLGDHKVHRGLYRLGIDRNDAKYMTVKAKLVKNGDLYFTNFSARLSSIDDGAYEPNPDDVNQQILKQNTKIEQNAKEVAIKANSVDVTRDIKSAVDGIQVGGVNLIPNSGTDIVVESKTTDTYPAWDNKVIYWNLTPGETYTFSVSATNTNGVEQASVRIFKESLDGKFINKEAAHWYFNADGKRRSFTFTTPNDAIPYDIWLYAGHMGKSEGKNFVTTYHHPQLEMGNKSTSWSPAPEDTSAEIKSAKDAAIQVASDQINLHVNEISTQFDDKLNKRINEQKTASEKFTSDGIEQVVTKVTNVKNDVDRLGDKVDGIQVGGRNLAVGTSNNWQSVSDFNGKQNKTIPVAKYIDLNGLEVGDILQIGITVKKTSRESGNAQWRIQADGNVTHWNSGMFVTSAEYNRTLSNDQVYKKEWQIKLTADHCKNTSWTPTLRFDYVPIGTTFYWKDFYVKKSKVSTDWSPAPEDINQQITNTNKKIDTQTLNSANIDEMKTQGHYFVKNLTGNPIGGWVYVDVTGNNNNRIRQDVYQDNGSKHMYRRGFNGTWSDWEQGAYISDVNNVKTVVTASVKNLGDRVTTQVNSITSKVDNMKIGGRNLLKGTRDFNSKYWYQSGDHTALADNPIDTSTKEIHSWLDWHSFKNKQTIQLDPSKNYMISADIAIYNGDGNGLYVAPYGTVDGQGSNLAGTDVNLARFPRQVKGEGFRRIYLPVTAHGRTLKNFRIEGYGNWNAGSGSVFISKIALYEGNTPLAWSDSSDDFVEAIKEVNTKWDVANGQIQGKVTETQVNNILNGKGYATQSWAQTMFQMKSNSITLQAVRDNITNGIQNQVNDTRTLLNNLQVGGRNYLRNSDKSISGWAQDLGTMPNEALNSLAGKTITVSVDVEWNNFKSDGSKQNRLGFEAAVTGSDGKGYWLGAWKWPSTPSGKERISAQWSLPAGVTFTVNNNSANGYVSINGTGKVSHAKIEVGNKQTDWSPAPEDSKSYTDQQITNTNKKIDTQVLDSANVDDLKTPGHYFIHNLTNSPITGWVYVDVAGGTDRLKQDVYQDSGYEHKSRRWFGNRWTEWTTDVNNKNVISQINITPDQIKIASNKIVIDGNTDIHGDLRTDRVRLVGKNGAIDMTGDTGIKLTNNDGSSMLLGRSNIDLMYKNDFRMNIDSSMITLMHRNIHINQGSPIAIGNIGAIFKTANNKRRGLSIRYNPGGDSEQLHGADFLDIGFNDPNKLGNIINQLEFTSKDMQLRETRKRKGINFLDNINLQGYQIINVGDNDQESDGRWSNDPLMIHRSQWDKSSQSNRYQPTIRLGYDPNNKASAGVTFLWDQVKPFGNRDISDLGEIWFNGIKFVFGWVNNPDMMSNQWQPSFYRVADDGSITSGIAFAPGSTWDLGSNQAHNITAKLMWG